MLPSTYQIATFPPIFGMHYSSQFLGQMLYLVRRDTNSLCLQIIMKALLSARARQLMAVQLKCVP
jgi:hypothetical protein